ncbi:MAG TPA: hypothetical protein VGJ62_07650 [Gemmatimonadaceae bacterium]
MKDGVSAAERFHFADFTRSNYRRLLGIAKESYVFRGYLDFAKEERFVVWRHDIDFSMHAARRLAEMEQGEGIRSTFFVNIHSEFYNTLEKEVAGCLTHIIEMGHEIGVHFDGAFYDIAAESDLEELVAREASILAQLFGVRPTAVAFHNPTRLLLGFKAWSYAGLVNTYSTYFQTEVGYCSDSNGYWRHRRLEDVLVTATDPRLQILTHPAWWQDVPMSPMARVNRCIDGRAEKTRLSYYELFEKNPDRVNVADG